MQLLGIAVAVLFVYAIMRGTDARMQAKGEETPAPEWARVIFLMLVSGGLLLCVLTAPAAMRR